MHQQCPYQRRTVQGRIRQVKCIHDRRQLQYPRLAHLEKGAQSSFKGKSLRPPSQLKLTYQTSSNPSIIHRRPSSPIYRTELFRSRRPPPIQVHSYISPPAQSATRTPDVATTYSGKQTSLGSAITLDEFCPSSPAMPSTPRFTASPQPPRSAQLPPAIRY